MNKINNILTNFLPVLVYIFPATFILGNLATNIFILLISLIGILLFNKELFLWNDKILIYLICSFFLFLLASTLIQFYSVENYSDWFKSILYFRFLLLLIVIKTMITKKIINLNYFLISCFLITSFVSIDIFLQFFFGKNIIGNLPIVFFKIRHTMIYYTGFFGKELIAGGFLLMFLTLGIFAIPILLKNQKKFYLFFAFIVSLILFLISLFLAGNRMPIIMLIVFVTLLAIIIKKKEHKKNFFILSFLILIIGISIIYKSEMINKRFKTFFVGVPNPITILNEVKKEYPQLEKYKNSGLIFSNITELENKENYTHLPFFTGHIQIFITSIDLIKDKPLIGKGIKSFRNNCSEKMHLPNRVCESHPHNFFLDITNDSGLIGLALLIFPVLILVYKVYREYLKGDGRKNNLSNWIYLAVILSVIINFFPFKSTGSFFSTYNSAYTFLILGFLIGLNEIRYQRDK